MRKELENCIGTTLYEFVTLYVTVYVITSINVRVLDLFSALLTAMLYFKLLSFSIATNKSEL